MYKNYKNKIYGKLIKEFLHDYSNIIFAIDTREQDKSVEQMFKKYGLNYEVRKVDFGDFGFRVLNTGINEKSLKLCYERKANIDEIINNLTAKRDENYMNRIEREFFTAKQQGYNIRFVCEKGSWEDIYNSNYRSKIKPKPLIAMLKTLEFRYWVKLEFIPKTVLTYDIATTIKYLIRESLIQKGTPDTFAKIKHLIEMSKKRN